MNIYNRLGVNNLLFFHLPPVPKNSVSKFYWTMVQYRCRFLFVFEVFLKQNLVQL